MRKKTVGMLLGMVMALSLTAGCGGQSQENHNDTAGETGTQEQTAQETEESKDQEASVQKDKGQLMMATTTSTADTGLLDYLAPIFQEDTGYELLWDAVGTGEALKMGENGDVDIVLVHAKASEEEFVNNGYGVERFPVMYNDFIVVGPAEPIAATEDIRTVFQQIIDEQLSFVSRGDDSGTDKKEKTIVYFPYATLAGDAAKGVRSFGDLNVDSRIGVYIGRNIDNWGTEAFNTMKNKNFEDFRNGEKIVMFATKAFGMGVDVDDIQNVYHYAVTGNLCDYVQEIGRAARKPYIQGHAIMDVYDGDRKFMNSLFGMSQIRQYQITKVVEGIYNTYKSKGEKQNFLISPESFTYIFNGKGVKDEGQCINKLKTCLLMLEKDFYDKYNFKVLISRPQSVFTKAFVCIQREYEDLVLHSKYASCFRFVERGRNHEKQADGSYISDMGDIYIIDLKRIWETYYPNISFPQFKYFYFNKHTQNEKKIMSEIRDYIMPRQKVNITARNEEKLSNLREQILGNFEYIADKLYSTYSKQYFTTEDFIKILKEHYGVTKSRIIANSLFDLVDPQRRCVKWRSDLKGKISYSLSRGDFKEYMRKAILKSQIVNNFSLVNKPTYSGYLSLATDETSMIALKLLSIFDYITYEVLGGSEPEIFVRLNDPNKIRNIALGRVKYSNTYVQRSAKKHERDVQVLSCFLNDLHTDRERWDFIEDYFLGRDVLQKSSVL